MDLSTVRKVCNETLPNFGVWFRKSYLGSGNLVTITLANKQSNFPNGYMLNDPLGYAFMLEEGNYEEGHAPSICVNPKEAFLYCSVEKIRRKSIKGITEDKLKKRLLQVKQLVIDNKDNIIEKDEYYVHLEI